MIELLDLLDILDIFDIADICHFRETKRNIKKKRFAKMMDEYLKEKEENENENINDKI